MFSATKLFVTSLVTFLCVNAQVVNSEAKFNCLEPKKWDYECRKSSGLLPKRFGGRSNELILEYYKVLPC